LTNRGLIDGPAGIVIVSLPCARISWSLAAISEPDVITGAAVTAGVWIAGAVKVFGCPAIPLGVLVGLPRPGGAALGGLPFDFRIDPQTSLSL
jgi:hypothetical protein